MHEPPCKVGDRVRITAPITNHHNTYLPVEKDLPVGAEGEVWAVNHFTSSDWQIGVKWDNGSGLALLSPYDNGKWEVVE